MRKGDDRKCGVGGWTAGDEWGCQEIRLVKFEIRSRGTRKGYVPAKEYTLESDSGVSYGPD